MAGTEPCRAQPPSRTRDDGARRSPRRRTAHRSRVVETRTGAPQTASRTTPEAGDSLRRRSPAGTPRDRVDRETLAFQPFAQLRTDGARDTLQELAQVDRSIAVATGVVAR